MKFTLFLFLISHLVFSANKPKDDSVLVDSVQKGWDQIKSYQAEFHQTVLSKNLGTREETHGTLYVQKPLKLRWESKTDGSVQILNGKELWQIRTSKRRKQTQVEHYRDVSSLVDLGALSFLASQIQIKKSYKYRILQDGAGSVLMALSAKSGPQETVLAEILKPSYLLGALKLESSGSETRIEFKNTKMNVSLQDSLFTYQPAPEDIVHHQ